MTASSETSRHRACARAVLATVLATGLFAASCAAPPLPPQRLSVQGSLGRQVLYREVDPNSSPFVVDTHIGLRQMTDEDRWGELDSQIEIGVSVQAPLLVDDPSVLEDTRTGLLSALSYDFGFRYAFDSSSTTTRGSIVQDLDSRTYDLSAGLLLSPFRYTSRFQPYLGGGVAFLFTDTDLQNGETVRSDRDNALSGYVRSGAVVEFEHGRHIGLDVRWLSNADVMIDGIGADIGAVSVSIIFGAHF